jgi:hypothetical protein
MDIETSFLRYFLVPVVNGLPSGNEPHPSCISGLTFYESNLSSGFLRRRSVGCRLWCLAPFIAREFSRRTAEECRASRTAKLG